MAGGGASRCGSEVQGAGSGVQGAHRRAGEGRVQPGVAGEGVRAFGADDPQLGPAGGLGRGSSQRRADDGGAGRWCA